MSGGQIIAAWWPLGFAGGPGSLAVILRHRKVFRKYFAVYDSAINYYMYSIVGCHRQVRRWVRVYRHPVCLLSTKPMYLVDFNGRSSSSSFTATLDSTCLYAEALVMNEDQVYTQGLSRAAEKHLA